MSKKVPFKQLSKDEIKHCLRFYQQIDNNGDGLIDSSELKSFIISMGYYPTERELFNLLSEMELEDQNKISFENFLNIIVKEKIKKEKENDFDNLNTFIALGGNMDKSGEIEVKNITNVLDSIFENAPNFNMLLEKIGENEEIPEYLNYKQFCTLLNN